MKKRILISIILIISLFSAQAPSFAENAEIIYNDSVFKILQSNANKSREYPKHMYNTSALSADKKLVLGETEFILNGDFSASDSDDVIKIAENQEVTIPISDDGLFVKNIAFLGAGYEENADFEVTFDYIGGVSKTTGGLSLASMTEAGGYDMGKEVVTAAKGRIVVFAEGSENVYLHSVSTESLKSKLKAITVKANKDMFIASMQYTLYSQQEIEENIEENISQLLDRFKNKTFLDINEENISDAEELKNSLLLGKDIGYEIASDDNITYVTNLIDGYTLYKRISGKVSDIESIAKKYITDGEFTKPADEVSDKQETINELENLIVLINEYNNDSENIGRLNELFEYFTLENTLNTIEYDCKEIKIYVDNIRYSIVNNDESVPERRNTAVEYDTDLYFGNGGTNSKEWEPLSTSFYESANQNVDIRDWLANDKFVFDIKPIERTDNADGSFTYKEGASQGTVSFDYPQTRLHSDSLYNNDGRGKDVLAVFANGETKTVKMSSLSAKELYLLLSNDDNCSEVGIDIIYKDGTSETVRFKPTGRDADAETRFLCPYYCGRKFGYPGRLYQGNISAVSFAISMYKLPLNPLKQIEALNFKASDKNYYIIGICEEALSNAQLNKNMSEIYNSAVENGEVITSDISKIKQLVGYYDEISGRGMQLSFVDTKIIDSLRKMIISIDTSIYRQDKNTVVAEIEFGTSVNKSSLDIDVKLNGEQADYTIEFSDSAVSAKLKIPVEKDTNGTIALSIDKGLSVEEYPAITLGSNYSVQNTVLPYVTGEFNDGVLSLRNNSKTDGTFLLHSAVMGSDMKTVYNASVERVILKAEESKAVNIDLYEAYKAINESEFFLSVTDEDLKPIFEQSKVRSSENTIAGADYTQPSLMLDTNTLRLAGFAEPNEIITLTAADGSNKYLYSGNTASNDDGYFEFEFTVNESDNSGYLTLTVGADSFKYVNSNVYFPTSEERAEVIASIKNAKTIAEMNLALDDAEKKLSVNFVPFINLRKNEKTRDLLAERIMKNSDKIEAVTEQDPNAVKKISEAQLLIKQMSVLEAVRNSMSEAVINNGILIYDEIMNYSAIDTNGVTLYNLYKNSMSKEGQNEVHRSILSKNYNEISLLIDDLKKNIIVNAVKYPKNGGTGHINAVITPENTKTTGVDASLYFAEKDKSAINKYIYNSSFANAEELSACIKRYKPQNPGGQGGGGQGTGSASGGGGGIVAANPKIEEAVPNTEKQIFADIDSSHWAYESVKYLYSENIISGKGNNLFCPNDTLTRAELVKILCMANGVNAVYTDLGFEDVNENDWYAPYVAAAYKNGWVNGKSEKEFAPNEKVTRQDICAIIYRTGNFAKGEDAKFKDFDQISEYAKAPVSALYNAGIISGFEDNTVKPFETCTRAQAASMIYRYINR